MQKTGNSPGCSASVGTCGLLCQHLVSLRKLVDTMAVLAHTVPCKQLGIYTHQSRTDTVRIKNIVAHFFESVRNSAVQRCRIHLLSSFLCATSLYLLLNSAQPTWVSTHFCKECCPAGPPLLEY